MFLSIVKPILTDEIDAEELAKTANPEFLKELFNIGIPKITFEDNSILLDFGLEKFSTNFDDLSKALKIEQSDLIIT